MTKKSSGRKNGQIFTTLCMVLFAWIFLFSAKVQAAEAEPIVYSDEWYRAIEYPQGNPRLQRVMSNGEETAYDKAYNLAEKYLDPDMFLLTADTPMTSEQEKELQELAKRITAECKDDSERIRAVAYWVAKNIYYDFDYYYGKTDIDAPIVPYEVYKEQRTICAGYAFLSQYLLVSLNIPCVYVTGTNHAFNIAYDSNHSDWIFFDATWISQNGYEDGTKHPSSYTWDIWYDFTPAIAGSNTNHELFDLQCLLPSEDSDFYYSLHTNMNAFEDTSQWYLEAQGARKTGNLTALHDVDGVKVKTVSSLTKRYRAQLFEQSSWYSAIREPVWSVDEVTGLDFTSSELEILGISDMPRLTTLEIPASVAKISLYECKLLENLSLDEKRELSSLFISGCDSLTSLNLKNTKIKEIGSCELTDLKSLTSLTLPDGLESVDDNGLSNLSSLEEIVFPASVKRLGTNILKECSKLKTVDYSATSLTSLPCGAVSLRVSADGSTLKLPSTITSVGDDVANIYRDDYSVRFRWIDENGTKYRNLADAVAAKCYTLKLSVVDSMIPITYLLDGGTNSEYNPGSVRFDCWYFYASPPTKTGYEFLGWYTDPEYSNQVNYVNVNDDVESITLYAKWELKEYTINYELDNGTNAADNPTSYNVTDQPIQLKDPTRKGYDFSGWHLDSWYGETVNWIDTSMAMNITLYAGWTPVTYHITYYLDGGTNSIYNEDTYTYGSGSISGDLGDPWKAGYEFKGWYEDPEFTVRVYALPYGSVGDKNLYAKWEKIAESGGDNNSTSGNEGTNTELSGLMPGADGTWYLFQNGAINFAYNGLVPYGDAWFCVADGRVAFEYTGLWYDENVGWWYVENGAINFAYNGLVPYGDAWFCVAGGRVAFEYTGLWFDEAVGWWYVENGAINFARSGLIPYGDAWFCVAGGRVAFEYTGLWFDQYVGWWFVQNGAINFAYNGLVPFDNAWFCVAGGRVAFEYTGLWYDATVGWWYVENGVV